MTQKGCIGVHVVANEGGYSRDKSIECIRRIGGKYVTVVNDPLLCQMVLDLGAIPLYRVHTQDWNDDDADGHFDGRVYVRKLHAEAPKGALLYIANEVGINNASRLNTWTLNAVDEANKLGRKVCAFNWSYQNPPDSIWDTLEPSAKAIAAGGHFFGWHEGYDPTYNTLAKAVPIAIGRFRYCQQRFGGKHLITEFAASLDPWKGWKVWKSVDEWAALVDAAVREVYAPAGVYVTPYTLFRWREGFEYFDAPTLQDKFARTNAAYEVKEQPVTQQPTIPAPTEGGVLLTLVTIPGSWINVRPQPNSATDSGDLLKGDVVKGYPPVNGWVYIEPVNPVPRPEGRQPAVKGWVSLQNGAVVFTAVAPPVSMDVVYAPAEHAALVAALDATELKAKAVLTEIAGIRKLLKGQVTPPSVPTFP